MLDILKTTKMKESIYLGIDVSKGYADFILIDKNQELLEELFQLTDNVQGHERLGQILSKYLISMPDTKVCCGLESTGGYERNWYKYLISLKEHLPIEVALLNPVVVKGISKASLNRTITDDVSALNIAIYLVSYGTKVNYHQGEEFVDVFETGRSLYTFQKMLNKQKTQLSNQLERILYQHFPEVLHLYKEKVPVWILMVLKKYPTPDKIKKAGIERLKKIKGVGSQKASRIINKASEHHQKTDSRIEYIIKHTTSEILHKEDEIKESQRFLENEYQDHPLVKLLTTIKGVGKISAISILFEIGNINRFKRAKSLAAYFGVNPEFKQSGDGKWKSHMSKKGRKNMRAVLYMVCFSAINCDPMMKKKYADIRAKGKDHYFAMGVLMHKMLRIIYGVLKTEMAYDPDIDRKNQMKSLEKQATINETLKQQNRDNLKKKRRYQNIKTEESPISKRKAKTIKELESSQE